MNLSLAYMHVSTESKLCLGQATQSFLRQTDRVLSALVHYTLYHVAARSHANQRC